MKFKNPGSEVWAYDGLADEAALARTTHMAVSAHQDDIEIMAFHGVLQCFGLSDKWFSAAIVTNGAGSPRDDLYASFSDEEMMKVRKVEQKKAAFVGEYGAQVLLDYTSSAVKDPNNPDVVADLKKMFEIAQPKVVYTHNLADKHDTHVSSALRVLQALRELPDDKKPETVYGCEVWRDLDWMNDNDKIAFDVSAHENIAAALLGVFDSQICGGKRYDLATLGRRRAHATYHASHGVDAAPQINFAMDLTPIIKDASIDPLDYVTGYINRFSAEVSERVGRLKK